MKKQNLILSTVVLAILMGCGESNNTTTTPTTPSTNNTATTVASAPTKTSPEEILAAKTAKGNLWLDALKGNFATVLSKKKNQIMVNTSTDLFKDSAKVLKIMSKDDESIFDVTKVRVPDPVKITDMESSIANSKRMSIVNDKMSLSGIFDSNFTKDKGLKYAQESFEYILELTPSIPVLDVPGKEYADTYTALFNAMLELGNYFYTEETYRLDDYAQGEALYNAVLEAHNAHAVSIQNTSVAYDAYYDEMHLEEKALLKENGLVVRYNIMEALDSITNMMYVVNSDDVSTEQLETVLATFETISTTLNDAVNDENIFHAEFSSSMSQDRVKRYLEQYKKFIIEIKVLIKNKTDNNPKEFNKTVRDLDLKYDAFIRAYNNVIS